MPENEFDAELLHNLILAASQQEETQKSTRRVRAAKVFLVALPVTVFAATVVVGSRLLNQSTDTDQTNE